jgi:acetylornithine/succinyldiaminopimelate/putrescine aminotransferase/3-oxoacyl-(acyl-carrier-protein) synthase/predicted amino acid dehydrogenase/acyl carrier protein
VTAPRRDILELGPARLKLLALELQARLNKQENALPEPVAIIGMAGRYPGADGGIDALWEMIVAKGVVRPSAKGRGAGATTLADVESFDCAFFNIGAQEARFTDPQHRLAMEVAWSAMENAGRLPADLGLATGVYVALCTTDYADMVQHSNDKWRGRLVQGNAAGLSAGRLSHVFGFAGPSMAVDSACSSSMLAAHLAVGHLRTRECDAALVAGVSVILSEAISEDLSTAGLLSRNGVCRPFDRGADGYVRGEGCGVLVLKRLSDAIRDGDRVIAAIRGTALNHDAGGTMMAPRAGPQRAVMKAALSNGGIKPEEVGYIEASSVGAPLADPVEVEAVGAVYGRERPRARPLLLGSVKANLGHLEAAAGVAALTKAALCLRHQIVPGHATFEEANPHLRLAEEGLAIAQRTMDGVALGAEGLRFAAVSGFSISGANVHLVLERGVEPAAVPAVGRWVLPLSAQDRDALGDLVTRVAERLRGHPEDWADLCYTLAVGRKPLPWRIAIAAGSPGDALAQLEAVALPTGAVARASSPALVFEADSPSIEALADEPAIASTTAEIGALAAAPPSAGSSAFAARLALARLLDRAGVRPTMVAGVGTGEVAAAVVAGLFQASDALRLLESPEDASLAFQPEQVPMYDPATGQAAPRSGLASAAYWRGPRPSALPGLAGAATLITIGSRLEIRTPSGESSVAPESLADIARSLFRSGFDLDWRALLHGKGRRIVDAPGTRFAPTHCWIDADPEPALPQIPPPLLSREEATTLLLNLLCDSLGLDGVSADDDLLGLGASSVELMRLVADVEAATGFRPSIGDFYAAPSVTGLVDQYLAQHAAAPTPDASSPAFVAPNAAPAVVEAKSKCFSLSDPRPPHAPLIDPAWQPDNPFHRYVEPFKGYLLHRLRLDRRYVKAAGVWMYAEDGRPVLDALSQYGALPFGHNPPEIWAAIAGARDSGEPAFATNSPIDAAGALASRLVELWPDAGFSNVVFANSGAEAVEAAIKLCRAATGRSMMLSTGGGFHGLTLGALGLGGNTVYGQGFAASGGGVTIPLGDFEALARALASRQFAGFVIEPIQGEAGIVDLPEGYLAHARELCDRHGTLLVVDEVQTGLGRTGDLFASQREGVVPDIMALAKALGGGLMPIGACLYRPTARSELFGLRHSSTFAGGALACRAGLATLDLLEADGSALIGAVRANGAYLRDGLLALQARHPRLVSGISGRGYMQGLRLDFESCRDTSGIVGLLDDQKILIHLVVSHLLHAGAIRIAPSFSAGDVLRIEPPLIADRTHLDTILLALEASLSAVESGDTLALISHLLDIAPTAFAEPAPRPEPMRRPPRAPRVSTAEVGRFGFVVHPLSDEDFGRLDPAVGRLDPATVRRFVSAFADLVDPLPVEEIEIVGAGGARALGELILVPYTPADFLAMPPVKALAEVELAVRAAQARGARIVGLGGFSSIVAQGGLALRDMDLPALTSGNAFTAVATRQALLAACSRQGIVPERAHAAVVGSGGMVGRAVATLLGCHFGRLTAIGNLSRPGPLRERNVRMALDLIRELAAAAALGEARPGSVAAAVAEQGDADPATVLAKLEGLGLINIPESLETSLPRVEAIALATSAIDTFLRPVHLGPGAVVCDVSRPFNVDPAVAVERPDVTLIDAGLVRLPPGSQAGRHAGPAPGIVYACAAETMIWALERAYDRVTPDGCMKLASVIELERLAAKHGFQVVGTG